MEITRKGRAHKAANRRGAKIAAKAAKANLRPKTEKKDKVTDNSKNLEPAANLRPKTEKTDNVTDNSKNLEPAANLRVKKMRAARESLVVRADMVTVESLQEEESLEAKVSLGRESQMPVRRGNLKVRNAVTVTRNLNKVPVAKKLLSNAGTRDNSFRGDR